MSVKYRHTEPLEISVVGCMERRREREEKRNSLLINKIMGAIRPFSHHRQQPSLSLFLSLSFPLPFSIYHSLPLSFLLLSCTSFSVYPSFPLSQTIFIFLSLELHLFLSVCPSLLSLHPGFTEKELEGVVGRLRDRKSVV